MLEDSEKNIKNKNATSDGCRGNIPCLQNVFFFSAWTPTLIFHYLGFIQFSNNQRLMEAEIFMKETMEVLFLDSTKEYLQRITTSYKWFVCSSAHSTPSTPYTLDGTFR